MRVALYRPDIPQNAGAIMRLAGCLGVGVDIIEPCGFVFDDRRVRRAVMDYVAMVDLTRHVSWAAFLAARVPGARLLALAAGAETPHAAFAFARDDVLLLGRESTGLPAEVMATADSCLRIPLVAGARSLNVATAAALVLGEALRQTDAFPA